jgi:hypothetical protein
MPWLVMILVAFRNPGPVPSHRDGRANSNDYGPDDPPPRQPASALATAAGPALGTHHIQHY